MTGVAGVQPVVLTARPGRRRDEHGVSSDPVVGKDILELLSSAMYLDPRAVYREYIQNAADAIDEAFAEMIIPENMLGRVEVSLDTQSRSVRIRDNGIGIPERDAERVLTSFGASAKRGKSARGFRGVGRLAAFGYAQQVSFKTKAKGERRSTEVRWDCRKLKVALLDPHYTGDLKQIVKDVVTVVSEDASDIPSHYFEVVLDRVVRIKNDVLLNVDEVSGYLSEIVPAPFHAEFPYAAEIVERLQPYIPACRFRIFVNDSQSPITRPHRGEFAVTTAKTDVVTEVEFIDIRDGAGPVQAVGWLLHHSYIGAIHASPDLRGLRGRVGDIQIGTGELFLDAFHEPRFNSWTIGEIHVIDPRVIPNGRRDGFEQNNAYSNLFAEVVLIARRQAKRCRQSSTRRNRLRAFDARNKKVEELFGVLGQHGVAKPQQARTRREIGAAFNEMKRLARSSVLTDGDHKWLQRRLGNVERRFEGLRALAEVTDPFADRTPAERAVYSQMVDLIYDCSTNKAVARGLVDKIIARLAAQRIRVTRRKKRRTG